MAMERSAFLGRRPSAGTVPALSPGNLDASARADTEATIPGEQSVSAMVRGSLDGSPCGAPAQSRRSRSRSRAADPNPGGSFTAAPMLHSPPRRSGKRLGSDEREWKLVGVKHPQGSKGRQRRSELEALAKKDQIADYLSLGGSVDHKVLFSCSEVLVTSVHRDEPQTEVCLAVDVQAVHFLQPRRRRAMVHGRSAAALGMAGSGMRRRASNWSEAGASARAVNRHWSGLAAARAADRRQSTRSVGSVSPSPNVSPAPAGRDGASNDYGVQHTRLASVPFRELDQIVESETEGIYRIALETDPPRWNFCVLTFGGGQLAKRNCDGFMAWMLHQHAAVVSDRTLPIAAVADPLETLDAARRQLSQARLRLALDHQSRPWQFLSASPDLGHSRVEHSEDDLCRVAQNLHIAGYIRDTGDSVVSLSMEAEVLKTARGLTPGAAAKGVSAARGPPHVLIVTESAIIVLLKVARDEGGEFRWVRRIQVADIEYVVDNQSTGDTYDVFMQLKTPTRWKDFGSISTVVTGKVDRMCELILRIRAADQDLTAADLVHKLRDHLRRIYLEQHIEKLPWREAGGEFTSRKHTSWALVGGLFFRWMSNTAFAAVLRREGTKEQRTRGQDRDAESGTVQQKRSVGTRAGSVDALRWLLWVTKNKMFDLVYTFSQLTSQSHVRSQRSAALLPLDGPEELIGRRLSLSLLALSDRSGRTENLILECLMYEMAVTAVTEEQNTHTMFQKESFASRVLGLYVGHSSLQYVRLVLTAPMERVLRDRSVLRVKEGAPPLSKEEKQRQFADHCSAFLDSLVSEENLHALPYEIRVIVDRIHSCCATLNQQREAEGAPRLSADFCVGAFLMQRLWYPAIIAPDVHGVTEEPTTSEAPYLTLLAKTLLCVLCPDSFEMDFLPTELLCANSEHGTVRPWLDANRGKAQAYLSRIKADSRIEGLGQVQEEDDMGMASYIGFGRRSSQEMKLDLQASTTTMKGFARIREGVLAIDSEEVAGLSKYLQSLHDALAKDTERLLAHLWAERRRSDDKASCAAAALTPRSNHSPDGSPGVPRVPRMGSGDSNGSEVHLATPVQIVLERPSSVDSGTIRCTVQEDGGAADGMTVRSGSAVEAAVAAAAVITAGAWAGCAARAAARRRSLLPSDLVVHMPVSCVLRGGQVGVVADVMPNAVRVAYPGVSVVHSAEELREGVLRKEWTPEQEIAWLEHCLGPLQRHVREAKRRVGHMRAAVRNNELRLREGVRVRRSHPAQPDEAVALSETVVRGPVAHTLPASARLCKEASPPTPGSDSSTDDDLWLNTGAEEYAPSPRGTTRLRSASAEAAQRYHVGLGARSAAGSTPPPGRSDTDSPPRQLPPPQFVSPYRVREYDSLSSGSEADSDALGCPRRSPLSLPGDVELALLAPAERRA